MPGNVDPRHSERSAEKRRGGYAGRMSGPTLSYPLPLSPDHSVTNGHLHDD